MEISLWNMAIIFCNSIHELKQSSRSFSLSVGNFYVIYSTRNYVSGVTKEKIVSERVYANRDFHNEISVVKATRTRFKCKTG